MMIMMPLDSFKCCIGIYISLYFISYVVPTSTSNYLWLWQCNQPSGFCTRLMPNPQMRNNTQTLYPSIEVCRLVCGKYGPLWPRPTKETKLGKDLLQFSPKSIDFKINANGQAHNFLVQVVNGYFTKIISENVTSQNCHAGGDSKIVVHLYVDSTDIALDSSVNEHYQLNLTTIDSRATVEIHAPSVFGARHGLETLLQLTTPFRNNDGSRCLVVLKEARITDQPAFSHRGLLLDTARNFLSIPVIERNIDAMAASKLNVLHWHITDSQSFPLELPRLPNMTKFGATSSQKIYHPSDVNHLINYAKLRGVRVIIEIDAPSHAGNGWQWGAEAGFGNLAVCVNQQPYRSYCIQPPCGQLNPINPNLYNVLKDLYADIIDMTADNELFHMGGDEVFIPCWNSTPEIVDSLHGGPRTEKVFLDLWADYQAKALKTYDSVLGHNNSQIVIWSSRLTDVDVIESYLPKNRYIIQTWVPSNDELPTNLLKLGYKIIASTKDKWYLDHGFWGTTTYHNWRNVYNNRIPNHPAVLGGEVCMWGELVDDSVVESRIWPRAAAAAERLWSNPASTRANVAETRFYRHRERLVTRGVNAEALTPRWCYQNEGACT